MLSHRAQYPRITIVTPSYNQAEFLTETLESVLSQQYPDLEYIVVDGGSTDGSADILRRYSDRLTSWTSEPDRGQSDAINKGFARATGEIIAFLNSDDTYFAETLWHVGEAFAANPEAGIVYGRAQTVSEDGRPLRCDGHPIDVRHMIDGVHPAIPQPAIFLRRKVIERVGYLDIDLHYAFDRDLFWRAFANFESVFIPYTLATMRLHERAKSVANGARFAPELLRVAERVIANPSAYPRFHVDPSRVRSAARLNGARFLYNHGQHREAFRQLAMALRTSPSQTPNILFRELPRMTLRMILGGELYQAAGRLLHPPKAAKTAS
jgi:glycosyltransferase involved in cell wall biosynthesis